MKKQKIKINDFKPEHLNQVKDILYENFEYPWSDSHILSENSFSIKKVVLSADRIIGFFAGEIIFSEGSITMIALKKEFQRKGIGTYLLDWFVNLSKEKGVKNIWLEVSSKNKKAIRFYENYGFIIEDIRPSYYKDGSDALIMRYPVYP
ncbi:ribosomal protein S18-alanine N-acetyltransferase [Persephonella sp.]|uniref:ribosomal protein S18-alanine N-acetyltransferase n=1 Tax=Persephonella sp. TaxID=2060922 RepID=UPI0025F81F6B|nr:ribosomal protein S18-alanine N-acetyltransferase [Persephonella sp.]